MKTAEKTVFDNPSSAQSAIPATGVGRRAPAAIEFPIKLAVAGKEGLAISEHFGHAKQFRIYEAAPDRCELLGTRRVDHYCLGQTSSQTAMTGILEAIKDCHAVFVAKIGDGPTEKLEAIGVNAVSRYAHEAIEASLLDYVRQVAAGEE